MYETLIAFAFVVLFGVVGWGAQVGAEATITGGLALSAIGFGYGIPTAIVYHWRLHQSLSRAGRLPERWWLSPTSHHGLIPSADRRRVLVWGAIGGSGFLVIVLGILVTTVGFWRLLSN